MRAPVAVICAHCGATFERAPGTIGGVFKVCSPECARARRLAQVVEAQARFGRDGTFPKGDAEPAAALCLECSSWGKRGCRRGAFSVCQPLGPARYYDAKEVFA